MVVIKKLEAADIERIGEVDRTEHVTLNYKQQNGELVSEAVEWNIPRWSTDGERFSTQVRIDKWRPAIENDGALFGALDGNALVGFAVVNPKSSYGIAEFVALFIGSDWRRQGIGEQLTAEVLNFARDAGAEKIFVTSNSTEAAVHFYQKQGFELAENVLPELHETLYALDPEGIHMVKTLRFVDE